MRIRLCRPAAVLLAALAPGLVACDGGGSGFGGFGSTAGPSSVSVNSGSMRLTAEPDTVVPELVPRADCRALQPFRASFSISVRTGRSVSISGIGFDFVDRFGDRQVPTVIPGSTIAASIPRSTPLPLPSSPPVPAPTSPPIPLPGTPATFPGVTVEADRTTSFPFTLDFACGVPSTGTIFIVVQVGDRIGSADLLRARVRVRG